MGKVNLWQTIKHLIPGILGLILFSLSIWAIQQELDRYGWQTVLNNLQEIPKKYLLTACLLMLINYVFLTGYDTLALVYSKKSLPYRKISFVSSISYAISNSVGLALLSGSAIRYRFYAQWGLSNGEIAKIIAFCNLSFWVGLVTVGGITFLADPLPIPPFLKLPFLSVRPLGYIFLTLTLAYLAIGLLTSHSVQIGHWRLPHIPFFLSLLQIGITAIDWGLAAAILYVLLPTDLHFAYPRFFGIYLLGQIAGLLSNVPGGLGVFETVILLGLTPFLSSVEILGALLGYRVIYYWIPLIVATCALGGYEIYGQFQKKSRS